MINTPGILSTGYERESSSSSFHRVTLYNDAATGIIWVENKVYLGYSEADLGKESFEHVFGSKHVLRYITCIVTTVFLRMINSVWTLKTVEISVFSM